jgi:predicted ribosomally synthesized peptide with nif11-like leader
MIQSIKTLLKNTQLQQQIKVATDLAEAVKLITVVGAEKGYSFSPERLAQAVTELMIGEQELSEDDLLAVAGGAGCHDYSCGGTSAHVQ